MGKFQFPLNPVVYRNTFFAREHLGLPIFELMNVFIFYILHLRDPSMRKTTYSFLILYNYLVEPEESSNLRIRGEQFFIDHPSLKLLEKNPGRELEIYDHLKFIEISNSSAAAAKYHFTHRTNVTPRRTATLIKDLPDDIDDLFFGIEGRDYEVLFSVYLFKYECT